MKHVITLGAACVLVCSIGAKAEPSRWKGEWPLTDFETTSVPWSEIQSGGPPKDGILAIDDPQFIWVADETQLDPREPVLTYEADGVEPRAYPIRYLTWHEIVNDTVADRPVAVTFCPLCNSAMVFDRRVGGELRTFGVSGKLRNSDMVMFDRETESWWQQAIGEGIVGTHTGDTLEQLPAWMESWEEYSTRNPKGLVMAEPAASRPYGENPYVGYDSSKRPFLYSGELPPHNIHPLVRVIRVGDRAWPLERLRTENMVLEGGVKIHWVSGQASALDSRDIGAGKDVGSIRVRNADTDEDIPHDVLFAFAFHAFWPNGEWMLGN